MYFDEPLKVKIALGGRRQKNPFVYLLGQTEPLLALFRYSEKAQTI